MLTELRSLLLALFFAGLQARGAESTQHHVKDFCSSQHATGSLTDWSCVVLNERRHDVGRQLAHFKKVSSEEAGFAFHEPRNSLQRAESLSRFAISNALLASQISSAHPSCGSSDSGLGSLMDGTSKNLPSVALWVSAS